MTKRNNKQKMGRETAAVLLWIFAFALPVFGQNDTIIDNVLGTAEDALLTTGPQPRVDTAPPVLGPRPQRDKTPLEVSVKMIRLVDHQDKVDKSGSISSAKKGVATSGDFLIPDGLTSLLEETYIGKAFSMDLLDKVILDIIKAYRETDYPIVDAYLPEQDITEGKLQIIIREARLGEVKVEGNTHSKSAKLIRQITNQPGERINTYLLAEDIEWLNSNPGRRVEPIYEKGTVDGTSDIVLLTNDLDPNNYYFSFGNTGIEATGEEEWTFGYRNTNLFGSEHTFAYNYNTDYDFDNLESHVSTYDIPLPWRHRLQFLGAYVLSDIPDAIGGTALDITGESIQASMTYLVPLKKINRKHRHNASVSIDYKSTNSDILFGGTNLFATTGVVLQSRFEYDITIDDKDLSRNEDKEKSTGYTRFNVGLITSPGDLVYGNSDADFDNLRDQSSAGYWYAIAGINRVNYLPKDWKLLLSMNAQATGDRLIATEQMRAGGYRTVRGFDESLIRGDSGLRFSAEVVSPGFPAFQNHFEKIQDQVNYYAFYDSAFLYSNEIPGEGDLSQSIQSIGVGLDYELNSKLRARLTYGANIHDEGLTEEAENGKLHFGVTKSF